MHKDMWQDPWKLGRLSFNKKDVIAIREEGIRRRTRKSQVRKCILNEIHAGSSEDNELLHGDEIEKVPEWQAFLRRTPNNLNLH